MVQQVQALTKLVETQMSRLLQLMFALVLAFGVPVVADDDEQLMDKPPEPIPIEQVMEAQRLRAIRIAETARGRLHAAKGEWKQAVEALTTAETLLKMHHKTRPAIVEALDQLRVDLGRCYLRWAETMLDGDRDAKTVKAAKTNLGKAIEYDMELRQRVVEILAEIRRPQRKPMAEKPEPNDKEVLKRRRDEAQAQTLIVAGDKLRAQEKYNESIERYHQAEGILKRYQGNKK